VAHRGEVGAEVDGGGGLSDATLLERDGQYFALLICGNSHVSKHNHPCMYVYMQAYM
jgi:hypothetical protein